MLKTENSKSVYGTLAMAWTLCLLAALFYSYDFLLRVQPNILVSDLMKFYNTNAAGIGILFSAYYWVYTPLQIPAGLMVDKYSIRIILTISALLCAAGAFLFPEFNNFGIGIFARVLMGLGSAFAFVAALKLAASWLPQKHFAAFSGLAAALGTIGALVTNSLLPYWVSIFGWQQTVLITGYIGLGIALLLAVVIRNKPPAFEPPPSEYRNWEYTFKRLWFIAKQGQFWINGLVGSLTFLPINVFAGLWGTSFLEKAYHMTPGNAAFADALIFIGMSVGGPIAGWISDHIGRRKIPFYIGCAFSTLISLVIIFHQNMSETMLYIMLLSLGFFTGTQILVFAIGKEISPPRSTGMAAASTNFLVTIGALIFAPLIGRLMVLFWDGRLSMTGIPIYSLHTYREALLVIPLCLIAAFILLLFVPETHCKMKYQMQKED